MTQLRLDHLTMSAATLDDGVAVIEAALGVPMAGGGQHPHMGTHNRLLSLGDLYLEVIAVDPTAPRPAGPRWFGLDTFSGMPRLTNWVAATDDLDTAARDGPSDVGTPVALSRGDYSWRMAVPADGRLPFDGAFPALISWQGATHPARALSDGGVRLIRLRIEHPDAEGLRAALSDRLHDPRIEIAHGSAKTVSATFRTPHGVRVLG